MFKKLFGKKSSATEESKEMKEWKDLQKQNQELFQKVCSETLSDLNKKSL